MSSRRRAIGASTGAPATRCAKYLQAELSHQIAGVIMLRATPTIDINSRRDLATAKVTPREKRTFTGEVALQRELGNGIQVSASFARTSSSQEDDYWNINATVAKTFD
jgi:hypothetical protein